MFTTVILNRTEQPLHFNQGREQAGSRRVFSTMNHIQTLNELSERTNKYKLPLCLGFKDFEKAFDSVSLSAVLKSLEHQGIENASRHRKVTAKHLGYSTATSVIRLHQERDKFKIGKGEM